MNGVIQIGLEPAMLEELAKGGARFAKAGATDLAVHCERGTSAATTASATMLLADLAGIHVFATGGIGGVHRGAADDVSHDLHMLARKPVIVVSAGAKAILDLPRTLEMLETLGVLVLGYRTNEFPAFYTRTSGLALEHRVDAAAEIATIARAHWELGGRGVLVCNPIPSEAALEPAMIDAAIARALDEAAHAGIAGKRLTPFLLARLAEVTTGASIVANRALAIHNAELAAAIAIGLAAER